MDNTQVVQVGELGAFSMTSIIAALIEYQTKNKDAAEEDDSDASWTEADELGSFYIDIQRQLQAFSLADDQDTLITREFSRHERRVVHNVAHLLHLQHVTVHAHRRYCKMRISKPSTEGPLVTGDVNDLSTSFDDQESFLSFLSHPPSLQWPTPSLPPGPPPPPADPSAILLAPILTTCAKKRKRQPRVSNGFICAFCTRTFDLASERQKHQLAHQPELANKHKCEHCDKGFRYPKDLRRHQKVHGSLSTSASAATITLPAPPPTTIPSKHCQPPATTAGESDGHAEKVAAATDVLNSRSSSQTSLTYSSTATSPETLFGTQAGDLGLWRDPLDLGAGNWPADCVLADGLVGHALPWKSPDGAELEFDLDEALEMALYRRGE